MALPISCNTNKVYAYDTVTGTSSKREAFPTDESLLFFGVAGRLSDCPARGKFLACRHLRSGDRHNQLCHFNNVPVMNWARPTEYASRSCFYLPSWMGSSVSPIALGRTADTQSITLTLMDRIGLDGRRPPWLVMVVGMHLFYIGLPVLATLIPLQLLRTSYWPLGIGIPLLWMLSFGPEKQLGAPWPWFASLPIWSYFLSYFPFAIYRKPLPAGTYVFAVHPHGALAFNRAAFGFAYDKLWKRAFPGIEFRVLTASAAFRIPVIREIWLWTFCVDASKETARRVLRAGKSILVYPGGEKEQMMTQRGRNQIYLKERKGFVKLAIESGSPLVPIYAFGEADLFTHHSFLLSARKWMVQKFKVAIPLISGSFGVVPYQVPVSLVVGDPIPVTQNPHPSQEQVDQVHADYMAALRRLFDSHKKTGNLIIT